MRKIPKAFRLGQMKAAVYPGNEQQNAKKFNKPRTKLETCVGRRPQGVGWKKALGKGVGVGWEKWVAGGTTDN